MEELTFEINSEEEIWELLDKKFDFFYVHRFLPNNVVEWWETSLKTQNGIELNNLSVRLMEMDIQTDLSGIKKIIEIYTHNLSIYQFDKPIADTLQIERLPEYNRNKILKQNGLRHYFLINFEFITIGSFDAQFIAAIKSDYRFKDRIRV